MPTQTLSATLDASFVIGICAREPRKLIQARTVLNQRIAAGYSLHSPHLMIMEAVFVLCKKQQASEFTPAEYAAAVINLQTFSASLTFPIGSDMTLLVRAEQMRQGYGCSHSADSFYIALAEQLAARGPSELLTFDVGQQKQAAAVSPIIAVTLLTA